MDLRKWVGSALKIATSWVPGLGTAVEEALDHWNERLERKSALASLLDISEHTWRPDSSLAALLRAEFGIVPFHGRTAEIGDLTTWCGDDRLLALRLYTAPGGFGKTRLLRHFVRLRQKAGWDAGFLPEGALLDEGAAPLFEERRKPLLLVLDYAESRRSEIETVISSARGSSRDRVRVVLLGRSEGDWWAELQRAGGGVGDFFQGPAVAAPIPLLPLTDSLEARQDSYRRAVDAFAEALGKSQSGAATAPAPALDDDDFDRALLIHAAALAAVEGEQVPSGDLLDWLLLREQRGIERVRERQAGLGPEFQRAMLQAAALITLAQGADSRAETVEIIRRAPSLADQPRVRLDQVAEALHVLYGGRRWCDGVEPDLVGEHLVWRELMGAPELLGAAFGEGIPEARLEGGLTVLNRLAQRQPEARSLLRSAMESSLTRLALPAARVAVAGGGPVGLVLAEALARERNLEVARQLDGHLPYPTTALREAAAEVDGMLWRELRGLQVEELTEAALGEVARRGNNLSNRLADLVRHEEALATIEEAVEIYRTLPSSRRDSFRPDLALSLDTLSSCLADLGLWEAALEAIEEAVEIRRELAQSQPDAFQSDLAGSLNNLSLRLADLGRRAEALEAIEQAVGIYTELVQLRPDAFRPARAISLTSLSNRLADLGRREQGLEAVREAVQIYRDLADSRPDAFRPALAKSLNNLCNRLGILGHREEALETIEEAVGIIRDLSHSRPQAFLPSLATSLNNLSLLLSDLGRGEEALDAIEEAVEIRRSLASLRPEAFRPALASSLNNLSSRLSELNRSEEALKASEAAVEIYRDLANSRPDAFRPDLAKSLGALHLRLREIRQERSALKAITEALDSLEPLFQKLPEAFAPLMTQIAKDYEFAAAAAGVPADQDRLRSIRAVLEGAECRR